MDGKISVTNPSPPIYDLAEQGTIASKVTDRHCDNIRGLQFDTDFTQRGDFILGAGIDSTPPERVAISLESSAVLSHERLVEFCDHAFGKYKLIPDGWAEMKFRRSAVNNTSDKIRFFQHKYHWKNGHDEGFVHLHFSGNFLTAEKWAIISFFSRAVSLLKEPAQSNHVAYLKASVSSEVLVKGFRQRNWEVSGTWLARQRIATRKESPAQPVVIFDRATNVKSIKLQFGPNADGEHERFYRKKVSDVIRDAGGEIVSFPSVPSSRPSPSISPSRESERSGTDASSSDASPRAIAQVTPDLTKAIAADEEPTRSLLSPGRNTRYAPDNHAHLHQRVKVLPPLRS